MLLLSVALTSVQNEPYCQWWAKWLSRWLEVTYTPLTPLWLLSGASMFLLPFENTMSKFGGGNNDDFVSPLLQQQPLH